MEEGGRREEGGKVGRGENKSDKQKKKRDRKSRELSVTELQVKKPERDIERLQKRPDVTETERQDEDGQTLDCMGQTEMWMVRERTDQRGMTREGESGNED